MFGRWPGRPWSLVRRLTGGVALIAVLAFVSQALVLDLWLRPLLDRLADETAAHALTIRIALAEAPAAMRDHLAAQLSNGRVEVNRIEPGDEPGFPGPPGGIDERLRQRLGADTQVFGAPGPQESIVVGLPVDGQTWWLRFAAGVPRAALLDTVVLWLALLAGLTLSALLLSVRFIARPIGRLAEQIAGQRGKLSKLDEDPRASEEMRRVVRAFNALVQTIDDAGAVRQQLLAGVSHDLRTPLARLRLRAETQCEPAVADAMGTDLASLERIVDQFLAYVQGDHAPRAGRPAPLSVTVAELVERYAAEGAPVSARIGALGPTLPDLAVQRLLGNLVDNALAYGQAPVCVELTESGGTTALRVFDQGVGMSEAEFALAQQPFVRLSATRSDLGHCGLGLAIVAQIARHWQGELRLARLAGGFGIEVTIPRA